MASDDSSTETPTQPVIVNAVLAYIQHLMLSREKSMIQESVCARFEFEAIKSARQVIFTFCEPQTRYVYQGQHGKRSPREKSLHALEGIYDKLNILDQSGLTYIIACPSTDLHLLLNSNGPIDLKLIEERFQKLEMEVPNLRSLELSHTNLQNTVLALQSNLVFPPIRPDVVIPPPNSSVLPSTADHVFHTPSKGRSDSVRSVKRALSTDSMDTGDNTDGFRLPTNQVKKLKRRKLSGSKAGALDNGVAMNNNISSRRQGTWGKSSGATSNDFGATVPDCFLYNCTRNTTVEGIIKNLKVHDIIVRSAERKSPEQAETLSFRVTLESMSDFDKLISGAFIPKRMKVREFIHFRRQASGKTPVRKSNIKPSYVYNSKPQSSEFIPHSLYQKAVIDLDKLSAAVFDHSIEQSAQSSKSSSVPIDLSTVKHSISGLLVNNDLQSIKV